jgi:hypothetical protein
MIIVLRSLIRGSILGFILSLFLFSLVSACQSLRPRFVDPKIQPYLTKFLSYCAMYGVDCKKWKNYSYYVENIEPSFLDKILGDKEKVVGKCNYVMKTVTIDKTYWENMRTYNFYEDLELVAFHEFGHCILNKDHVTHDVNNIMYPSTNAWGYIVFYQKIMDEFFGCKNNCPQVQFTLWDYL